MKKSLSCSDQKSDRLSEPVFNIWLTQQGYAFVLFQTLELLIYFVLPMSTMVYYRVVSTKLSEEEHDRLLDVCNVVGCPPSALIRQAIMKIINSEQRPVQKADPMRTSVRELIIKSQQVKKESVNNELEKLLGAKFL